MAIFAVLVHWYDGDTGLVMHQMRGAVFMMGMPRLAMKRMLSHRMMPAYQGRALGFRGNRAYRRGEAHRQQK